MHWWIVRAACKGGFVGTGRAVGKKRGYAVALPAFAILIAVGKKHPNNALLCQPDSE